MKRSVFASPIRLAAVFACGLLVTTCGRSKDPLSPELSNRVFFPENLEVTAGQKFGVPVYLENNVPLSAINIPLIHTRGFARCDSVSFIGSRVSGSLILISPILEDTILLAAIDTARIETGSGLFATLHFWVFGNAPETVLAIDVLHRPGLEIGFADTSLDPIPIIPEFTPARIRVHEQR